VNSGDHLYRLPRWRVLQVIVLGLLEATALIAFVLVMISLVDYLGNGVLVPGNTAATQPILARGAILVGIVLFLGLMRAWQFSVSEKIGYDVVRTLRMQLYGHMQGMAPRQIQHRSRGGLLLRFVGDLSMLRMWISRGLMGSIVASIVLVALVGLFAWLSVWIVVAYLAVTLIGAAMSLAHGKPLQRVTRTMRRRRSLLTSNIDEQINALAVPQVFGRSPGEYARLSRQNDSLNLALFRTAELRGRLRGISLSTSMMGIVAVLVVGSAEIYRGTVSIGVVVAAITVSRHLTGPVRVLGLANDYWQRSRVSVKKLEDFLASSSRDLNPPDRERLKVKRGGIELRGVTVYGALESVSGYAAPGTLVAITGPSGAGKSTLLGVVARLAMPTAGDVLIDGQLLNDTTPRSSFRFVSMVSPDLPLMRGSVKRNLTYRFPRAPEEEIQRVVMNTGLQEVLDDLPDGLDSWVTEGGGNLSAGQRKRLELARALMGNPPVLLLDEPSANLDAPSKEAFRRALLHHHGTVLLVTHDQLELDMADEVWTMAGGHLVSQESGDAYRDRRWRQRHEARS
jgi:ABC-type multidrug transport system fused ATPase/permease subunit